MAGTRRTFGTVRTLPSGRVQARYSDPVTGRQVTAPVTFDNRGQAEGWLSTVQADMLRGRWLPEARKVDARTTLATYAARWIEQRTLKPRTRHEYQRLLDAQILPDLGALKLAAIDSDTIRAWYAAVGERTGPTERTHAYQLLRTVLGTAVADGLLAVNACHIRGAGQGRRARTIRPATMTELEVILEATPARLRMMLLLATFCALRYGEVTELRVKDVDVVHGVLRIRRAVTRVGGEHVIGVPKSQAGSRDVAVPPHLLPLLVDHLGQYAQTGTDGLLFPALNGGHITSMYRSWYAARHLAGRDDLRFHDLRHTGATMAAATGASLAELMARLGHSTVGAALRYQHAAAQRDREIAAKLSELAAPPETEGPGR